MTVSQWGRSNSGLLVLVAVGALVILALGLQRCTFGMPGLTMLGGDSLGHRWPWLGHFGLFSLGGLLQLGLAVWVGFDAERRGMNGWLWGLLVLFTFVVGLLVYLIVGQSLPSPRNGAASPTTSFASVAPTAAGPIPGAASTCPACRAEVREEYKVCPLCSASLRCRECDEPLRGGWRVCPLCATPIARSSPDQA